MVWYKPECPIKASTFKDPLARRWNPPTTSDQASANVNPDAQVENTYAQYVRFVNFVKISNELGS